MKRIGFKIDVVRFRSLFSRPLMFRLSADMQITSFYRLFPISLKASRSEVVSSFLLHLHNEKTFG